MTSRDFCYWLQGALELGVGQEGLSAEKVKQVQNHLNLVFVHEIDPSIPGDPEALQAVHDGVAAPPSFPHTKPTFPRPDRIGDVKMRC